jgi:hypothetical protein
MITDSFSDFISRDLSSNQQEKYPINNLVNAPQQGSLIDCRGSAGGYDISLSQREPFLNIIKFGVSIRLWPIGH